MGRLGGPATASLPNGRVARIRDAGARDAKPLVALLDAVAAEPEPTLLLLPGQSGAREWRRRITDSLAEPRALLIVAEVDAELVGDLGLMPDPHPNSPHVCSLGISIARPWRRRGIGGALLETALAWARAQRYTKATLGVFAENRPAAAFYERHGFATEGVRVAQYARAGRYHDEVVMSRFLTPA